MKPLVLFALLAPTAFAPAALAPAVRADPAPAKPAAKAAPAPGKAQAAPALPKRPNAGAAAEEHDHAGMPPHSHDGEDEGEKPAPFGLEATNTDFFWRQSDKAFHDGDYERAIANHKAIVALDPTDTESFGVAAWLLWSMGKKDEADAHLQRGLKANPISADMWDTAAQQYDLEKRLPEAKEAYINALKFTPAGENTMMLRRRLAHAAEKAGDKTLALETWRGLVKDFPNDQVNKNNLARVEKGDSVVAALGNLIAPVRIDVSHAIASLRAHFGIGPAL